MKYVNIYSNIFLQAMCARNAANRNKGKDEGYAINHHSGTTPYNYRVASNEEKGHLAHLLQTVCDVYSPSHNAQEKVVSDIILDANWFLACDFGFLELTSIITQIYDTFIFCRQR